MADDDGYYRFLAGLLEHMPVRVGIGPSESEEFFDQAEKLSGQWSVLDETLNHQGWSLLSSISVPQRVGNILVYTAIDKSFVYIFDGLEDVWILGFVNRHIAEKKISTFYSKEVHSNLESHFEFAENNKQFFDIMRLNSIFMVLAEADFNFTL